MSVVEQVQQVSNSPILWLRCGITVALSAVQAVLLLCPSWQNTGEGGGCQIIA